MLKYHNQMCFVQSTKPKSSHIMYHIQSCITYFRYISASICIPIYTPWILTKLLVDRTIHIQSIPWLKQLYSILTTLQDPKFCVIFDFDTI